MIKPYKKAWKNCSLSVCSIRFFKGNDIEIVTLTGFKSGCYIFTNDLVNMIQKVDFVEIKFVKDDGHTASAFERLSMHDFSERIITTYDAEITGFAVISTADLAFDSIPSLILAKNRKLSIGNPVAVLGFQYDNPNLAIKSGIISTFLNHNSKRYIQFDGSIIWGNSGSPLISLDKGDEVVSVANVVARDEAGDFNAEIDYDNLIPGSNTISTGRSENQFTGPTAGNGDCRSGNGN